MPTTDTTADMVMGLVRQTLGAAGGLLVAHGYGTNDQMTAIVGGVMAAGMVIWSVYQKHQSAQHTALKVDAAYVQGANDGAAKTTAAIASLAPVVTQ